jgi:hypothetical protein
MDDAYTEAQRLGKTPALCAPGSSFFTALQSCNDCVAANAKNTTVQSVYTYPEFESYISFCGARPAVLEPNASISSIQSAASSLGILSSGTISTTVYVPHNSSQPTTAPLG